jgi:hypothetical protein
MGPGGGQSLPLPFSLQAPQAFASEGDAMSCEGGLREPWGFSRHYVTEGGGRWLPWVSPTATVRSSLREREGKGLP